MGSTQTHHMDKITANYYDGELLIDFEQDGQDRGGWPPYYFSYMNIRRQFDNGDIEIGLKPIFGKKEYVGTIDEKTLDRLEPFFEYILEVPADRCT